MDFMTVPLTAYARVRALHFLAQGEFLNRLAALVVPGFEHKRVSGPELESVREAALALLARDRANIRQGVYPLDVLMPESPIQHWARFPKLLIDSLRIGRRRVQGRTTEFDGEAEEYLDEVPRYYRRCFHFQSGGYLTRESAELYEHQVEILFAGTADAMRRTIIEGLRKHFGSTDGKGLSFLEVGAGTGRASKFVSLAFPKAKIVAVDLSPTYLRVGQRRLADFQRIDFLQADAAKLPFKKGTFDAVFSVFLFHEMPRAEREAVPRECVRVTKAGGFVGLVDSLQKADVPAFDGFLERFPVSFHEPYYREYSETPMEGLLANAGISEIESSTGFFSKSVSGRVPAEKPVSSKRKK